MAAITVRVDGLRELGEAMRALGNETSQKIAHAMASAAARLVRDQAKKLAPVATGEMRDNIIAKKLRKSETVLTSEYKVGVKRYKRKYANTKRNVRMRRAGTEYELDIAYYWRYVEFGTVKMAPRPFIRPAIDQNKFTAIEAMRKVGQRRIEAAARKAAKT